MPSFRHILYKVEKLESFLGSLRKKTAITWLESDGYVYPNHNDFSKDPNFRMTQTEYIESMKAKGYTDFIFITWNHGEKMQNTNVSNDDLRNDSSVQFFPGDDRCEG